jgi:hypothetical protein
MELVFLHMRTLFFYYAALYSILSSTSIQCLLLNTVANANLFYFHKEVLGKKLILFYQIKIQY